MFELSILRVEFFAGSLNVHLRTRKVLGWPKICKLAHALLWEYRCKQGVGNAACKACAASRPASPFCTRRELFCTRG
jgi:hypothetical protein